MRRVDPEGDMLRASEVRLVVEIVSPGSRRMDTVIKHREYADAGIPYYWIADLDPPVSLHVWHLPTSSATRTPGPSPVRSIRLAPSTRTSTWTACADITGSG